MELLLTPVLILTSEVFVLVLSGAFLEASAIVSLALLPLTVGAVIGLFLFILLDRFWMKVDAGNIGKFIRIPIYIIILLAIAGLVISSNPDTLLLSLAIMLIGMGGMGTLISTTSLVVYSRTYLSTKTSGKATSQFTSTEFKEENI